MSLYDENAAVLRDMTAAGDNLEKPRPMDFNHLFPTREDAIAFARRVDAEGLKPVVRPYDNPDLPFDVKRILAVKAGDEVVLKGDEGVEFDIGRHAVFGRLREFDGYTD